MIAVALDELIRIKTELLPSQSRQLALSRFCAKRDLKTEDHPDDLPSTEDVPKKKKRPTHDDQWFYQYSNNTTLQLASLFFFVISPTDQCCCSTFQQELKSIKIITKTNSSTLTTTQSVFVCRISNFNEIATKCTHLALPHSGGSLAQPFVRLLCTWKVDGSSSLAVWYFCSCFLDPECWAKFP